MDLPYHYLHNTTLLHAVNSFILTSFGYISYRWQDTALSTTWAKQCLDLKFKARLFYTTVEQMFFGLCSPEQGSDTAETPLCIILSSSCMTMDTGISTLWSFSLPGSEEIEPWVVLCGACKKTEGEFTEKLKHVSEWSAWCRREYCSEQHKLFLNRKTNFV